MKLLQGLNESIGSVSAEANNVIKSLKQSVAEMKKINDYLTKKKPKETGNQARVVDAKNRYKRRRMGRLDDIDRLESLIRKLSESFNGSAYMDLK